MEQHPVPQHIASFEFKLFGNLTVRQFITLAIPVGIAAAIYFSSLPVIIRFPTAAIFGLFGLFAALVPVGGRPADKWLVAFIKAIMSPTQRVWTKETKLPQFLSIVAGPPPQEEHPPESITTQGRARLREYLRSLPKGEVSPLDVKEQIAVSRLELETSVSSGGKLPPPIIWPTAKPYAPAALPQISVAPKVTMAQEKYEGRLETALPPITTGAPAQKPKINQHAKPFVLPGLEKKLQKAHEPETVEIAPSQPPVITQLASETNPLIEAVIPIRTPDRQIRLIHGIGKTRARKLHFAPPVGFDLSKLPIRGEKRFEISQELKKRFAALESIFYPKTDVKPPQTFPQIQPTAAQSPRPTPHAPKGTPKPTRSTLLPENVSLRQQPSSQIDSKISILTQKSKDIPLTSPPTPAQIVPLTNRPNVISGIVIDNSHNPLENVILIVNDAAGIPVRAYKTNKLGQFLSATPLANGAYTLQVESDLAKFVPFTINLRGEVLRPLEVRPVG